MQGGEAGGFAIDFTGNLAYNFILNNMDYTKLASDDTIEKTVAALKNAGIEALVVENAAAAKQKVLELLPEGAQVMTMQSMTLKDSGITEAIDESGKYDSIRKKFATMDRKTQHLEMNQIGGAPDWTIGSVHAATTDGKLLVASNTGSQLGAYAYGAMHVIFVVGAQKIVQNMDEGLKRIYDYVLPLESERLNKAYSLTTGSNVSKLLIINKEFQPGRITVLFVKEKIGF